jgi:hypothetical protein
LLLIQFTIGMGPEVFLCFLNRTKDADIGQGPGIRQYSSVTLKQGKKPLIGPFMSQ